MSKPVPADIGEMIVDSARALGKVDRYGSPRGVTMISAEEIEAMALLLASLGLTALPPKIDVPDDALTLFPLIKGIFK